MATLEEKLNFCAVRVNNGSGCVFQPNSTDFSYVLTVRHNIVRNGELLEPAEIKVYRNNPDGPLYQVTELFAQEGIDIAVLKIKFLSKEFDLYSGKENRNERLSIYGYPNFLEKKNLFRPTPIHCTRDINIHGSPIFEIITDHPLSTFNNGAAKNLIGFSGSGIFKIDGENIILKGIFPALNDPEGAHNKVKGIHLDPFNELLKANNQPELLPDYLECFSFLREEAFKLEVSAFKEDGIKPIRTQLRNKALEIVKSNLTPVAIKNMFQEKLLLNEADHDYLDDKIIWRTWLEFLTIMNLIKAMSIGTEEINEIFQAYRIKYSHSEKDWTQLLRTDLANSDYHGLGINSKVIIQSKKPALDTRIILKGKIPPNIRLAIDESNFKVDQGIEPFTHFDFIHSDYLMKDCIIDKLENYSQFQTKEELLEALRIEYLDLFSND